MTTIRRDTGAARLTGIQRVRLDDPALQNWVNQITNWIETRSGTTGNDAERAVTSRELRALSDKVAPLFNKREYKPGDITVDIGGATLSFPGDQFVEFLKNTRLYRDLLVRLDDPTRFNRFQEEIRTILLRSIAGEAAARGAAIQRTETLVQDANRSIAMLREEVTASLGTTAAGVRQVQTAFADANVAQAAQITQLEASLGNYYQDGTPGRAILESTLATEASKVTGLRAQYTLKVSAGGALAGYGIAATEVNGTPSSAFIVQADKFAVVAPSYTGGLTTTPSVNDVPFGIDAGGIYLNNNVYIKGTTKINTGGKTILDGLRGSVAASYTSATWSDASASQAIWTALGKAASPPNTNHLVIGDTVTRTNGANPPTTETRYWNDTSWVAQGVFINGNMVIDGSLAASKIDTRSLTIKDASGNIIFSSGNNLDYTRVGGTKPPADADNTGSNVAAGIFGQGSFATINQITSGNQSTLIADLSVGRIKIARVSSNTTTLTLTNGIAHLNINHGYGQNPISVTLAWVSPAATDAYPMKTLALNFISTSQIGVTMSMFTTAGVPPANGTTVQCFWIVL